MSVKLYLLKILLGTLAWLAISPQGFGAIQANAFSDLYKPVATVASTQAQVVYFYSGQPTEPSRAANVYVDKEFHTSLLPGGFTAFCVAPGNYSLLAFLGDAPKYLGKQREYPFALKGGETVFMRVNLDRSGLPQIVARADAERELVVSRRQMHVISRASTVKDCEFSPTSASRTYSLQGDALFPFGKSGYADVKQEAIGKIVTQLRAEHVEFKMIEVIGHTDPIGSNTSNDLLGMRRAETVRRILIDGGMPANLIRVSSAGSRVPVATRCSGSQAQRISCYGPDRRVVLRIEVQEQTP